ncbi:MAG: YtxH domain-containing protein, partial [Candidatus Lutacidiplasmatales archaeon]
SFVVAGLSPSSAYCFGVTAWYPTGPSGSSFVNGSTTAGDTGLGGIIVPPHHASVFALSPVVLGLVIGGLAVGALAAYLLLVPRRGRPD